MRDVIFKLFTVAGPCCILASAWGAWFQVPIHPIRSESGDWETIQVGVSHTQVFFKAAMLILLLSTVALRRWPAERSHKAVALATVGFCLSGFYPYCQVATESQLAARAAWLHVQHENLTWLGGDIFRNQEYERTPRQVQLYVTDSPRQVSVLPTPVWSWRLPDLSQLPVMFAWLGYTNAFCQFVGPGWFLALVGSSLWILSMVFVGPRDEMQRLRTAIRTGMIVAGLGVLVAWYAPLRAGMLLHQAAKLTSRGDHLAALAQLDRAADTWKPLREDTEFVVQHGLSDLAAGRVTPYAELYRARLLERDELDDQAISIYRGLLAHEDLESSIRREACRGVLRFAERAANAGEWQQALVGLDLVRQYDPCSPKALFASLICYMQLGDAAAAQQTCGQLQVIYGFMNYPNRCIVLAKAREMTVKALLQQSLALYRPDAEPLPLDAHALQYVPARLTFVP